MSWVEVDRAGWRWVHGLVIPFLHIFLICLLNFNFRSIAIPKIISSSLFFKLHLFKLRISLSVLLSPSKVVVIQLKSYSPQGVVFSNIICCFFKYSLILDK